MAWGVPWDYLLFALCASAVISPLIGLFLKYVLGVNAGGMPLLLFVFAIFGAYGRIRAKDDPEFFTIHLIKINKMPRTKGDYKGNVYHP